MTKRYPFDSLDNIVNLCSPVASRNVISNAPNADNHVDLTGATPAKPSIVGTTKTKKTNAERKAEREDERKRIKYHVKRPEERSQKKEEAKRKTKTETEMDQKKRRISGEENADKIHDQIDALPQPSAMTPIDQSAEKKRLMELLNQCQCNKRESARKMQENIKTAFRLVKSKEDKVGVILRHGGCATEPELKHILSFLRTETQDLNAYELAMRVFCQILLDYSEGRITFQETNDRVKIIHQALASLVRKTKREPHLSGLSDSNATTVLIGSFMSQYQFNNMPSQTAEASKMGDLTYKGGNCFGNYLQTNITDFFADGGITVTDQDLEEILAQVRIIDLFPFVMEAHLKEKNYKVRLQHYEEDTASFMASMCIDRRTVFVHNTLNLAYQALTTFIESDGQRCINVTAMTPMVLDHIELNAKNDR
jgi:hypothetical protein